MRPTSRIFQTLRTFASHSKHENHAYIEKTPITTQLWQERQNQEMNSEVPVVSQLSQTELLVKTPKESRKNVVYNFSQNPSLRHLYINSSGGLHMGKIFEDLDALAGNIAQKHCDDSDTKTRALNLVTASVDKITKRSKIDLMSDYILFGKMVYVGRSSMDILIEMYKADGLDANGDIPKGYKSVLSSYFTFAARDFASGKSVSVNKLKPETAEEQSLFDIREKHAKNRAKSQNEYDMSQDRSVLTPLVERGSAIVDMPALAHPNVLNDCFYSTVYFCDYNIVCFRQFSCHKQG
jgi:acyl-coenzyme A thioesterase 9